eukprot:3085552-Amphidinium_carterae.2
MNTSGCSILGDMGDLFQHAIRTTLCCEVGYSARAGWQLYAAMQTHFRPSTYDLVCSQSRSSYLNYSLRNLSRFGCIGGPRLFKNQFAQVHGADEVRKNCNSFSDCALFYLLGRAFTERDVRIRFDLETVSIARL